MQDEENIYFVMEFLPGGDLCSQRKLGLFNTIDKVKFYFAEVIIAIGQFHRLICLEELHKNNIVYRDMKLDNLMIAKNGHLKVRYILIFTILS